METVLALIREMTVEAESAQLPRMLEKLQTLTEAVMTMREGVTLEVEIAWKK
jgi:hypothetical protein